MKKVSNKALPKHMQTKNLLDAAGRCCHIYYDQVISFKIYKRLAFFKLFLLKEPDVKGISFKFSFLILN